ncbi:hypothetical protein PF327_09310 [Sulfurovum sp. XTW-4]|uniref:Lipoprotein n=1 Tax=Sulfurovum xiamenensis TaxID=3019066 RepID=A0ABT7QTI6_9BACT|nr:hypothetical protein [Sulfurovum xiamenensis]MDM5264392.1 hypothetical protein [Sulfurovum xiamenensis]
MKNTYIKHIALTVLMGLFLNACGGGSSSSSTNYSSATLKVPSCGITDDLGKSVAEDVTGKTIQKMEDGAEVRIWHSPDSTKLACMISGEAVIVDN